MRLLGRLNTLLLLLALLLPAASIAQDVPVRNWTVPPFDTALLKQGGDSIRPLTHTQGDNPAIFVPFGPCRLTDSRVVAGGPGPIPPGGPRNYDFVPSGCPAITGLQAAQDVSSPIIAWSLNFSVINTQGPGFLFAYPTGGTPPPVSILNYQGTPGEIKNNAAIVPVDPATGSFTVGTGVNGTDVIIDANGVFLSTLEGATTFRVNAATNATAIHGYNPVNGIGVLGESHNYNGVWAQSDNWDALAAFGGRDGAYIQGNRHGVISASVGTSGVLYGLFGGAVSTTNGATGVYGNAGSASNFVFGVKGVTASAAADSAGVKGVSGYGDTLGDTTDCAGCFTAGVRGISGTGGFGVFGISRGGSAVAGIRLHAADTGTETAGYLGSTFGYGVYALGGMGGTGAKFFLEPHATDPSLVIKYIALEGPESGTYFRGKAKFQNGIATIDVPEDFRMVTDRDGLSIQVTPIGQMATVAVQSIDLDRIVVRGSRNVEFFYTVNGVRRSFKDHVPIQPSHGEFEPEKADVTLESHHYLTPDQQRVLIHNGTYAPDGKVNMETARRLGWDKVWEASTRPEPRPASDTP